jgi:hypothetical protein
MVCNIALFKVVKSVYEEGLTVPLVTSLVPPGVPQFENR